MAGASMLGSSTGVSSVLGSSTGASAGLAAGSSTSGGGEASSTNSTSEDAVSIESVFEYHECGRARSLGAHMTKPKYTRTDSATHTPSRDLAPTPNVPIRAAALEFDRWQEGERFAGGHIPLAELGGAQTIGVNLVELAPGKQSCPFHYHLREEEHFYVLSGACVLRSGDERHAMGPGDYVCFPAATGVGHCFENPHDSPCLILAIGTRDPAEIAVYPDSNKAKLRALQTIIPLPEASLAYWDGEDV